METHKLDFARCAPMALALAAAASCGPPQESQRRPNVVLICMDTVRADGLGCYGNERNPTTPHLDALAAESILFTDASATAGWTKPSVPSILTGTYPIQHGVYEGSARGGEGRVSDVLSAEAVTLAEVFREHGYDTAAFVHNAQLRRGNGFEQGFDLYVDGAGSAREIRWQAVDWLAARTGDEPFFLYLHFLDAHWPYAVPDEYAVKFARGADVSLFRGEDSRALRDAINHGERVLDETERRALRDLYDGSIRYIDDQLGSFFESLVSRGAWDDTVVCVLSDHGEEFLEHGRIGHGHGLYENLLRVPLILRIPGREARHFEGPVSLVDTFPTLLSAAGIEDVAGSAGVDRLGDPHIRGPIFAEHKGPRTYMQSLRRLDTKLVRSWSAPRPEREKQPVESILRPGDRWEAEVARTADGSLRATALKPRDEPPSDPIEIKGTVSDLRGPTFSIHGIRAELAPAVEYHGVSERADRGLAALSNGTPIKARGSFRGDTFVVGKLKYYPADSAVGAEIRGAVADVAGDWNNGRLRIGEVVIEWNADTEWDAEDISRDADRWTRGRIDHIVRGDEDVLRALELRAENRLFDLARDPDELDSVVLGDGSGPQATSDHELASDLDRIGRSLLDRRQYVPGEAVPLGEDALEELRNIGYVE